MYEYALDGEQDRPKVQTAAAFEGHVYSHVEFDDIIPGDAGEGGNGHVLRNIIERERVVGRAVIAITWDWPGLGHIDARSGGE